MDGARPRGSRQIQDSAGLPSASASPTVGRNALYGARNAIGHSTAESFELNACDIEFGKRLAVGGFAEVFIGSFEGTLVAIKRLLDQDMDAASVERFKQEVRLLSLMRHPNLILFIGFISRPYLAIVSEFMARGSLHQILKKRHGVPLDAGMQRKIVLSVARGCAYLHSRVPPILHLDLKSPNILVDERWHVKIADFGLSRSQLNSLMSSGATGGTAEWMAPEILRNEPYDDRADVYSFGVVIWELITCQVPWAGLNQMQVVGMTGFQRQSLPTPTQGDPFLIQLFTRCCSNDPQQRPSMLEIIKMFENSCDRDTLGPGANMFALTNPAFGHLDEASDAPQRTEGCGRAMPSPRVPEPAPAPAPAKATAEARFANRMQSLPSLPEEGDAQCQPRAAPRANEPAASPVNRFANMSYQQLMNDTIVLRPEHGDDGSPSAVNPYAGMTNAQLLAHTLEVSPDPSGASTLTAPAAHAPALLNKMSMATALRASNMATNPYTNLSVDELLCLAKPASAWPALQAPERLTWLSFARPVATPMPPLVLPAMVGDANAQVRAWTDAVASSLMPIEARRSSELTRSRQFGDDMASSAGWSDLESRQSSGIFKRMHSSAISDMRAALAQSKRLMHVGKELAARGDSQPDSSRMDPGSVPASGRTQPPPDLAGWVPADIASHPAVRKLSHAIDVKLCEAAIMQVLSERYDETVRVNMCECIDKRKEAATERTSARNSDPDAAVDVDACIARAEQLEDAAQQFSVKAGAAEIVALGARACCVSRTLALRSKVSALREFAVCLRGVRGDDAEGSSGASPSKNASQLAKQVDRVILKLPAHFQQVVTADLASEVTKAGAAALEEWAGDPSSLMDVATVTISSLRDSAAVLQQRASELKRSAELIVADVQQSDLPVEDTGVLQQEAELMFMQAEDLLLQCRVERLAAEALKSLSAEDRTLLECIVGHLSAALEASEIGPTASVAGALGAAQCTTHTTEEAQMLQTMLVAQRAAVDTLGARAQSLRRVAALLRVGSLPGADACERRLAELEEERSKLEVVKERVEASWEAAEEAALAVEAGASGDLQTQNPRALSATLVEGAMDLSAIASVSSRNSSVQSQKSIKLQSASANKLAAADLLRQKADAEAADAERLRAQGDPRSEEALRRAQSLTAQAAEMESLASIDLECAEQASARAAEQLSEAEAAMQLSRHMHQSATSLTNASSSASPARSVTSTDMLRAGQTLLHRAGSASTSSQSHAEQVLDNVQSLGTQKLAAAWQAVYTAERRSKMLQERSAQALVSVAAQRGDIASLEALLAGGGLVSDAERSAAQARLQAMRESAAAMVAAAAADTEMARAAAKEVAMHVKEATDLATAGREDFDAGDDELGDDASSSDDGDEAVPARAPPDWEIMAKEAWVRYNECEQHAADLKQRSDAKTWQAVTIRADAEKQAAQAQAMQGSDQPGWAELAQAAEALNARADELEASAASDVLDAIAARLAARSAEKAAVRAQDAVADATSARSDSATSDFSDAMEQIAAKRNEQQHLKMRFDAKTAALAAMRKEADDQAHGAIFMRDNGIQGWEDVQRTADHLSKQAVEMAASSNVDLVDWKAVKESVETLLGQLTESGAGADEDRALDHSRDERRANALARSKAAMAAEFLGRSKAKMSMVATMRDNAAARRETADAMESKGQPGWQSVRQDADNLSSSANQLEESAAADALAARTHHLESLDATLMASYANKANRDNRVLLGAGADEGARALRDQYKLARQKKNLYTEQAAAMDTQAQDKIKDANGMRASAAQQSQGAKFMRDNNLPGWEVAEAKADALRNAAISMEAAAAADQQQAAKLHALADAASRALDVATAAARDAKVLDEGSEATAADSGSSSMLTGSSMDARILSQRLQEASHEETVRSFNLAEKANMLQARANVRRTQAEVLRKQSDEQRRGLQFMRSHNMPGWESLQNRVEGYAKAAAEMEAQAAADEAESLAAGAEARVAAGQAESAAAESAAQSRMEKLADTDYSVATTATVSAMDLENKALLEVWAILGLEGMQGSEQAVCQAVFEKMMTAIAKQAFDNQLELITQMDDETKRRMASMADSVANIANLRANADSQAIGAKFMKDNNMAGWEVAEQRAKEFLSRANDAEVSAAEDRRLAAAAKQTKQKAQADYKDAETAWNSAQTVETLSEAAWTEKADAFGKQAVDHQIEFELAQSRAEKLVDRARAREKRSAHLRRQAEMQAMGHKFVYDSLTSDESDAVAKAAAVAGMTMADEYAKQADRLLAASDKDITAAQRYKLRANKAHHAAGVAVDNELNARNRAASKAPMSDVSSLLSSYAQLGTASSPASCTKSDVDTISPCGADTGGGSEVPTSSRGADGSVQSDSQQSHDSVDSKMLAGRLGARAYQASMLCMHLSQEASVLRDTAAAKFVLSQTLQEQVQENWRSAQRVRNRKRPGLQEELPRTRDMRARAEAEAEAARNDAVKAAQLVRQAAHAACIACELGLLASLRLKDAGSLSDSASDASSAASDVSNALATVAQKADVYNQRAARLSAESARAILRAIALQDAVVRKVKQALHLRKQAELLSQGASLLQRIKMDGWAQAQGSIESLESRAAALDEAAERDSLENSKLTARAQDLMARSGTCAMKAAALRAIEGDASAQGLGISSSQLHAVVVKDDFWDMPLHELQQAVQRTAEEADARESDSSSASSFESSRPSPSASATRRNVLSKGALIRHVLDVRLAMRPAHHPMLFERLPSATDLRIMSPLNSIPEERVIRAEDERGSVSSPGLRGKRGHHARAAPGADEPPPLSISPLSPFALVQLRPGMISNAGSAATSDEVLSLYARQVLPASCAGTTAPNPTGSPFGSVADSAWPMDGSGGSGGSGGSSGLQPTRNSLTHSSTARRQASLPPVTPVRFNRRRSYPERTSRVGLSRLGSGLSTSRSGFVTSQRASPIAEDSAAPCEPDERGSGGQPA